MAARGILGPLPMESKDRSPPAVDFRYKREVPMKIFPLFLAILASAGLYGREWTSTEGKKIEAEFVSASGGMVTLKRADNGQNTTLPVTRLSAEDQAFIKEQASA